MFLDLDIFRIINYDPIHVVLEMGLDTPCPVPIDPNQNFIVKLVNFTKTLKLTI